MRRLAPLLLLVLGVSANANPAFEGNWMMDIRPDGAPLEGMLTVERNGDEWQAFVEGGPAPIEVDGDRITVDFDSRDIRGFVFVLRLTGTLAGDRIAGDFEVVADSAVLMKPGTWTADRYSAPERSTDPAPVDLSGTWKPMPGVDLRKYSMVLTPAAQEWYDGYLMHYDQPNVRCVSPGVTAMAAWGGYPFEILDGEDRLTFIYEVDSEVRRVFLDGTEAPEFYPHSGMGFSTGR